MHFALFRVIDGDHAITFDFDPSCTVRDVTAFFNVWRKQGYRVALSTGAPRSPIRTIKLEG